MAISTVLRLVDQHKHLCMFRVMMACGVTAKGCWIFQRQSDLGGWLLRVTPVDAVTAMADARDLAYYVFRDEQRPPGRACAEGGCVNPWHRGRRPSTESIVMDSLRAIRDKTWDMRCSAKRQNGRLRRMLNSQPMKLLRKQARKPDLTRESIVERRRARARRRRRKLLVRLQDNISAMVRTSLRRRGLSKNRSPSFQKLGYSPNDLRIHLERQFLKGMTWENMGKWHIDHIIPLSSFRITGVDCPEFRAAWALTNLRPLWAADNIRKGATRETLL